MIGRDMETNKLNESNCLNCVYNNDCYIQTAVKNYFRYKMPKHKINFDEYFCRYHQNINVIINQQNESENKNK